MRQLTFVDTCRLEWWEVEEPRLCGDGEALVAPVAVATCDLDPLILHRRTPFQPPFAFGHECVARVVETGEVVRSLSPGQLVAVPFQISCGECGRCREGRTGNCERVAPLSQYGFGPAGGDWGGALSDLLRVPFADHMLVPLPDGIDPAAVASLGDNLADAWRTVAGPLKRRPGATVLVMGGGGSGSIGLYAVALASALGAQRVDYIDSEPDRLERAGRLGANPIEGPRPGRLGPYPITVDASAQPDGLSYALRSLDWDGECTSIGVYRDGTGLPLFEMYTRCVSFHTGRCHARAGMPEVLRLVADGKIAPELVSHAVVSWEEAGQALAEHERKHIVLRTDE